MPSPSRASGHSRDGWKQQPLCTASPQGDAAMDVSSVVIKPVYRVAPPALAAERRDPRVRGRRPLLHARGPRVLHR